MTPRREAAPRLIEWTGERLVPWAPDVQVVYEHFHRYLWALPLVRNCRVLDLASGEGFGSALLAETAASVTGVDIDERAIAHGRANYTAPNLEFRVASAHDLGELPADGFDVVVAFEMIEHVVDQEAVVAEVARVMAPGGLFVISTPERSEYSDATGFVNPFHERELTRPELLALLRTRFAAVELFSQRAVTGSRIEAVGDAGGPAHAVWIERAGEDWRSTSPPAPLYLVAVASDGALPELPADSSLSDAGLALVEEARERELAERAKREAELLAERERLIGEVHAEHARALRAEEDARRVRESVAWKTLEAFREAVDRIPWVSRALRAIMRAVHRALP
jgi:SAM-dependent methyltransferase